MDRKNCLLFITALVFSLSLCAQGTQQSGDALYQNISGDTLFHRSSFVVGEISISGDKKTKFFLIERELPFKTGDSVALDELVKHFDLGRQRLMNTRLFNEVVISLKNFKGNIVNIQVDVKERWYLFPVPFFKPIDRNLAEWAKRGYDLKRVNYGAKLDYYNFTGRNDKLKAWFITGYTRQMEFSYDQPYADKSLKHGYGLNFSYATSREINHLTIGNEQRFIPYKPERDLDTSYNHLFNGQVLSEILNLGVRYTYRPAIKTRHTFRLNYLRNRVDESVVVVNPKYFNNGKRSIAYPEASYTIDYNNVDYVAYPLKGFIGEAQLLRRGIGKDIDLWQLTAKGNRGWEIGKKLYFGLQGYAVVKFPFEQPYFNNRAFGYGDLYLRGLEKYVIDGVVAGMLRNTLRKEIFHFSIPFGFSKSHDKIPFKVYAKTYGDMGYAYNKTFKQNSLANRMLYTGGVGIDFLTLYDLAFRFEYSFNQLGQKGLFLHFKNDF
jgi:outer membrane protein assembly factor BamA